MEIGIGLPNAVKGTTSQHLIEFARTADEKGFATLGTIDRVVYGNYEPLVALGAAAAVTERIELMTTILIGPYRNTAVLAKQALSVQAVSGGRFTLGIAIGARDDDYEATGTPTQGKGERLDKQLEEMKRIWDGEDRGFAGAIGPRVDPPSIVVGGTVEASFERAAKYGDGWIMGGGTPDQFAEAANGVRVAWREAGRDGEPRLMSLAYFSLGEDAEGAAKGGIGDYYAWMGEEMAGMISGSAATSEEMVKQYISGFEQAGCDTLVMFPAASDPEQAELLAKAAGL
jgi:alkanesulfonate monooxygenase SsuD/methylene tetrahydromethanopterin reductase-like flavin-dependent oxidoreductase (luciferase family)